MSEAVVPPPPPEGLGERGRAFWDEMNAELEFDGKDAVLIHEAARTLDRIADLDAALAADGLTTLGSVGQKIVHPAVSELRQQQLTFGRIIALVNLPEDDKANDLFRHRRAKRAAAARWAG